MDKDGKLVVDGVTNGIDATVREQIREYLNLPAERDRPENPHKEMGKGKPAQQMEAAQDMERRRK